MTAAQTLARCHELARSYRAIGKDFSASQIEGFARDIEAGIPAHFYRHWIQDAEARLWSIMQEAA